MRNRSLRILSAMTVELVALVSTSAFAQWERRSTGLPASFVCKAIDACDSNTAVIAVAGNVGHAIYRTIDGGLSWVNVFAGVPDESVWDVSLVDSLHIWAATQGFRTTTGEIFATTDGGKSWQRQYKDSTKCSFMDYIEMFDENRGVAMGDGLYLGGNQYTAPVFPRTTDGGKHWISQNDSSIGASYSIWMEVSFVNIDTGFFFATYYTPNSLFKTTDGAFSWANTGLPTSCSVVKFYDANLGLVASLGLGPAQVARTLDGGRTWEVFGGLHVWTAYDIEFIPGDPSKVWMLDGDQKRMFFSSDTGRTWGITVPFGGRDIVFTDALHGWLGKDNAVYRTVTGGLTDIEGSPESAPETYGLEQNYPNPFNPSTTIRYELPNASMVRLSVYDILGREVAVLVNEKKAPGSYEVAFNPAGLSSGVYVYRMSAGPYAVCRKMILMK